MPTPCNHHTAFSQTLACDNRLDVTHVFGGPHPDVEAYQCTETLPVCGPVTVYHSMVYEAGGALVCARCKRAKNIVRKESANVA